MVGSGTIVRIAIFAMLIYFALWLVIIIVPIYYIYSCEKEKEFEKLIKENTNEKTNSRINSEENTSDREIENATRYSGSFKF